MMFLEVETDASTEIVGVESGTVGVEVPVEKTPVKAEIDAEHSNLISCANANLYIIATIVGILAI